MFTVTSRVSLAVTKEDDGVPVDCIIDHPAAKDLLAQRHLRVLCECGSARTRSRQKLFELRAPPGPPGLPEAPPRSQKAVGHFCPGDTILKGNKYRRSF